MVWPVDYTWYLKSLRCSLSGSTKEVYETGSQITDLYLISSVYLNQKEGSLRDFFNAAISRAVEVDWPDLANEMGLTIVDANYVNEAVNMPAEEDKVTPPSMVFSPLHVILIAAVSGCTKTDKINSSQSILHDDMQKTLLLADAILKNLNVRRSTDLNAKFTKLLLNSSLTAHEISEQLIATAVEDSPRGILFVFLSRRFGNMSIQLYESIWKFCRKTQLIVYGMHFQDVSPVSWRALSLHVSENVSSKECCIEDSLGGAFSVTGMLDESASCIEKYPVILYLIHLAVRENGLRKLKKSTSKYKDSKFPSRCLIFAWRQATFYLV